MYKSSLFFLSKDSLELLYGFKNWIIIIDYCNYYRVFFCYKIKGVMFLLALNFIIKNNRLLPVKNLKYSTQNMHHTKLSEPFLVLTKISLSLLPCPCY